MPAGNLLNVLVFFPRTSGVETTNHEISNFEYEKPSFWHSVGKNENCDSWPKQHVKEDFKRKNKTNSSKQ